MIGKDTIAFNVDLIVGIEHTVVDFSPRHKIAMDGSLFVFVKNRISQVFQANLGMDKSLVARRLPLLLLLQLAIEPVQQFLDQRRLVVHCLHLGAFVHVDG